MILLRCEGPATWRNESLSKICWILISWDFLIFLYNVTDIRNKTKIFESRIQPNSIRDSGFVADPSNSLAKCYIFCITAQAPNPVAWDGEWDGIWNGYRSASNRDRICLFIVPKIKNNTAFWFEIEQKKKRSSKVNSPCN